MISADPRYERKLITIKGRQMAYVDEGQGDAIVFQHAESIDGAKKRLFGSAAIRPTQSQAFGIGSMCFR